MQETLTAATQEKDVLWYVSQVWSSLVVGLIVYLGGVSVSKLTRIWVPIQKPLSATPVWFQLWHATKDWHPVLVAGTIGLIPWPVPVFIHHWWARVLWFMGVGAICGHLYAAVKRTLEAIPELVRKRMGLEPRGPLTPGESEEDERLRVHKRTLRGDRPPPMDDHHAESTPEEESQQRAERP